MVEKLRQGPLFKIESIELTRPDPTSRTPCCAERAALWLGSQYGNADSAKAGGFHGGSRGRRRKYSSNCRSLTVN